MEILHVSNPVWVDVFLMVVALTIGALLFYINNGVWKVLGVMPVVVICLLLIVIHKTEASITYKVIVTDWNEFHERGYIVVNETGKVVTAKRYKSLWD